jgi:outer membrane protein
MNRHRRRSYLVLALLHAVTCVLSSGCDGLFRGWDYLEYKVPPERVRQIDTLDLDAMSVPADSDEGGESGATRADTRPAAGQPPAEIELSLEEVRAFALKGNLTLKVELLNPSIAAEDITEAEAAFEAVFFTDAVLSKADLPVGRRLRGAKSDFVEIVPGVRIPLRTGGTIGVSHSISRFESSSTSSLNPAFATDAELSITQPLLRDGGVRANTHPIRIARLQHQQSEAGTKLSVISVLAAADRVYWILRAFREELEVRKQEHDLAKTQLERARRQVAAGVKPEVEVIRAELGVADSLEAIIIAENNLRDSQRELKRILQKPGLGLETPTVIVPVTPPTIGRYRLDPAEIVELALANRMELLELELQIARESSTVGLERNRTLPLVTLGYTYGVNGLGGSGGDSYDLMFEKRFEDHRLGLAVEVPLGNQAARSRLRRAILRRIRTLATKKDRESLIRQEVYDAIDGLEATWQRILAARQTVIHAKRVLEAEQRQFDQGLRTSTEVLEAQAAHADAQSSLIRAMSEYQIAQVDLAVATGTILGAARIRWEPTLPAEIDSE